ncbi:ABC transporter permease [Nonomuraea sp. NPDC050643]|uniref:ABC transporter permease n=1 Tax=Nonomuraea sp. NPDC050643 TaxID=3155660 RepID=UPI00340EDAD2
MIRMAVRMAGAGGLVVAFFAVLGGMALITGAGVIVESGLRSSVAVQRLAGADVVVSARQSLPREEELPAALPERAVVPDALVTTLREVPGVAAAAGDVSFPAALLDEATAPKGEAAVAGHGWASFALAAGSVTAGTPPQAADEVALRGVRPGRPVRIVAAGRTGTYRVSGNVDAPGIYFADPTAATLAGRTKGPRAGTVDLVALRAAPGTGPDALAGELARRLGDRYEISTGRAKGDAESPGMAAARGLLIALPGSIGGVGLTVVGFVVGGGLALSINRQRRDLALLRAAGATPRQVRRLIAVQAGVASAAALLPGAALGYHLAARFGELLVSVGALPAALPLVHSPLPAVAATSLLAAVVRLASWAASLRASRMSPVEGLTESQSEPRAPGRVRTGAGLLLMPVSLVLSCLPLLMRGEAAVIGPATAALLAVVGLALAGPRLVQLATAALAARLPRGLSAPAWLAVHNTGAYALRTAGAVAALSMVLTLGLSVVLTQTTVVRAKSDEAAAALRGLRTITAPALGGIPHGLLDDVRALPGVERAAATATTTVLTGSLVLGDSSELNPRPAWVLGPDADGVVDLGVVQGGLAGLRGATVAVDESAGRVGQRLDLVMGDGARVSARVVATYRRSLGFGPVVVSRDLAAGHTTSGLDSAILVRGTADLTALGWPGVEVAGTAATASLDGSAEALVNVAVLAVLLAYVLVAVANRLVATTTARRGELDALRRLGATPAQLRSMIRWEAALLAAAASGAGLALPAVPLAMVGLGFLGRPWPAGPLWLAPAAVAVVAVVVWLALGLPARRAITGGGAVKAATAASTVLTVAVPRT